jgi:pimeloyl-ACP methyl ester carboxylesterase
MATVEITCSDVFIGTGAGRIYGRFQRPAGLEARVLQILVHGATYSHTYWNFPGFDGRYSYSDFMARAGYATLAIDQLGVGRSDHPPSETVTFHAAALAVEHVVAAVRRGELEQSFEKVLLVGHSMGSLVSLELAARSREIDGLLLSGFSHSLGPDGFTRLTSHVVSALADPVVKDRIPAGDAGYLSVMGGRPIFYDGDADPALIEADEATRSEMSGSLNAGEYMAVPSNAIGVPVLIANGMKDIAFCVQGGGGSTTDCSDAPALLAAERRFFSSAAPLETYVLAGAGHNLNLTWDAQSWYAAALAWCERHFPL